MSVNGRVLASHAGLASGAAGNFEVSPTETTTYTFLLRADYGGKELWRSEAFTLVVNDRPTLAAALTAPGGASSVSIARGDTVELHYSTTGAQRASINATPVLPSSTPRTHKVSPPGSRYYQLTATDTQGRTAKSDRVLVTVV